jgi:pyridoxamine 5'-phosphate oxidase
MALGMDEQQSADAIPVSPPLKLFSEWFALAKASELNDPDAVALATATPDAAPSVRMVLLKVHGPDGFVFYTNAQSRKGGELLANPQAAMLFHWKSLRRQIRIEGRIEEVDPATADAYFASRSRDSQLGALASDQSRPLGSRAEFLGRIAKVTAQHLVGQVPRPPHWTGFRLVPHAFEFWMDRPFRLHERRRFELDADGNWASGLLYP